MRKRNSDIIVIVPAYKEGQVIRKNLNNIMEYFPNVVCVNDCSPDNTAQEALRTGSVVISHPINIGQGGAIQTGIEFGLSKGFRFFATIDADGQHSVEDLDKMAEEIRYNKDIDIIFGSRFLNAGPKDMPTSKRILLKFAIKFSNFTSGLKFTDTHNGLRVFNSKTAKLLDIQMSGYSHASEILDKIRINNLKYKEFPTTVEYTEYSKSKGQASINAVNIFVDQILNYMKGKK